MSTEGEPTLTVAGWVMLDDALMLESGQGYTVPFDPMPKSKMAGDLVRAELRLYEKTPARPSPAQRSAAPKEWRDWVQEAVAQANHEHFKAGGDYVMGRARGRVEALEAVLREIDRRTLPTGDDDTRVGT